MSHKTLICTHDIISTLNAAADNVFSYTVVYYTELENVSDYGLKQINFEPNLLQHNCFAM